LKAKPIQRVLSQCHYSQLGKRERGVARAYLIKLTDLSRAQATRLIGRWRWIREVRPLPPRQPSFAPRNRPCDVVLLARVDAAYEDLSGPAIRRILQREHRVYHKPEFERLAGLSVSHLYNLRRSETYRRRRVRVEPTRGTAVSIAERRKPDARGRPGYLRVDRFTRARRTARPGRITLTASTA